MQRKTRFSLHFRVHGKFAISDGKGTKNSSIKARIPANLYANITNNNRK